MIKLARFLVPRRGFLALVQVLSGRRWLTTSLVCAVILLLWLLFSKDKQSQISLMQQEYEALHKAYEELAQGKHGNGSKDEVHDHKLNLAIEVREDQQVNKTVDAQPCHSEFLDVPQILLNSSCQECQKYTCHDLLYNATHSQAMYKQLNSFMESNPRKLRPDADFINMTRDCDTFRKTRGYHLEAMDEEEADFPIAFNILMHKDAEQVERLLRALYRPQNIFCIHIDAKSPEDLHGAMRGIASCFPNMFISSKLERVIYAGFSRLQADINCMKDLVNSTHKWKYLINTAAQAFPLKTNSELVKALKIYNGANDVEGIDGGRIIRGRFEQEYIEINGNDIHRTGAMNPPPPDNIDIVRGSAYAVFSRGFVKFIVTDPRAIHLLEWSRKTYSPDEHYWATLHHTYTNPHLMTPGAFAGVPSKKPWLATFAAWGGVDECGGMWQHGCCVYGITDLPTLSRKREHFANKFFLTLQPLTLECLDKWIEHKVKCPPEFDYDYYRKLPFVYP